MLDNIKKASNHIIFKLMLGVLILSFAFTGIYGYISSTSDDYVAKIGSNNYISTDAFIKAKRRQIQNIKNNYPQITDEQLSLLNINKNILQSLILRKLVELEAQSIGITISDKIVAAEISKNKIFQDKNGKFDPMIFKALLRNSSIPENEYVENIKNEIATNFLLNIFSQTVPHPSKFNNKLALYQHEKRETVIITATATKNFKPTTKEIESFYNDHLEDFSTPETRNVEYIFVQPSHFSNQITITEQEKIDATSHLQKDKNFNENKKNILTQLKFQKIDQKMIETIQEIEDELASDETLEKLSKKFKVGFGKISNVKRNSKNLPSYKSFREELFKADLNQPSETIQIDESKPGYYIINVTKIDKPKPIPLNDKIRSKITIILAKQQQNKQNLEYIKKALVEYNKTKNLKKLQNIKVSSKIFDRPTQQTMSANSKQDAVIEIFNLKDKQPTKIFLDENNSYSFMILKKIIKPVKVTSEELKKANSLLNSYIVMAQQNQFIEYLQTKYPVTIREDLLKRL